MSRRRPRKGLSGEAQNLARFLIASYFIAVGAGLVPGTLPAAIANRLAPADWQQIAVLGSALATQMLAMCLLTGIALRAAALMLAFALIATHMVVAWPTGQLQLEAVWRDAALIGALMFTYASDNRIIARHRSLVRWRTRVRNIKPRQVNSGRQGPAAGLAAGPEAAATADLAEPAPMPAAARVPDPATAPATAPVEDDTQNIFADLGPARLRRA